MTAAAGADAVALMTDWPQYTTLPFRKIAATMNQPIIFDGRNCLHRDVMRESGLPVLPDGPAGGGELAAAEEQGISLPRL